MALMGGAVARGDGIEAIQSINKSMAINPGGAVGLSITPTVSSVPTALLGLNAGAANLLMGFRVTIGAGDDTVASVRLSNGFPSAAHAPADDSITFVLSETVSRIDVVGIMNDTATGNCIDQTDTAANALAQMTTFDFAVGVSKITVTVIADKTGQFGELSVEGYSYA